MLPNSPTTHTRRDCWLAAAVIVGAGAVAYYNSFGGVFVLDDQLAIVENQTIRSLGTAWAPPRGLGLTVEGRPLLNFSLAVSYALSGNATAGFHAMNLAIHLGAALALFGLVRRTLLRQGFGGQALGQPFFDERVRAAALPLAAATALLWVVHPLQTESVTYVVQRAESQMGLFFLLALYCFVRGVDCHPLGDKPAGGRPGAGAETCHPIGDKLPWLERSGTWFGAAGAACLLGAATKEVTAAVPVLALVWDRTFVAGSFREAWRARREAYLGLFVSWILIAALVATAGSRGGTVGFGSKVAWWDYALTQCEAIAHYLRLALWPSPLIFDYGVEWKKSLLDVAPQALLVGALVAGTFVAVARKSAWGFLGLWFFAMLAPTSLIPGNRQTIAEHRMYLSLAAVLVPVVVGLFLAIDGRRKNAGWPRSLVLFAAIAVGFGGMTAKRNEDYRSVFALYRDTVEKRPGNADAHYNLANELADLKQPEVAVLEYEEASRLRPDFPAAHFNRGNVLWKLGRLDAAVEAFRAALRVKPDYVRAHTNLGAVFVQLGRKTEAAEQFAASVRLAPESFEAHENLGNVLMEFGRLDEARAEFEAALRVQPGSATAHFGRGNVFFLGGKMAEAAAEYERAVRLDPALTKAREQLQRARTEK